VNDTKKDLLTKELCDFIWKNGVKDLSTIIVSNITETELDEIIFKLNFINENHGRMEDSLKDLIDKLK
jgi:hypothetical protein